MCSSSRLDRVFCLGPARKSSRDVIEIRPEIGRSGEGCRTHFRRRRRFGSTELRNCLSEELRRRRGRINLLGHEIKYFDSNSLSWQRLPKTKTLLNLICKAPDSFRLKSLWLKKLIEIAIESGFPSIQTSDTCSSVMEYNYGFHLMLDDLKVFNQNFQKVQILQEPR